MRSLGANEKFAPRLFCCEMQALSIKSEPDGKPVRLAVAYSAFALLFSRFDQ